MNNCEYSLISIL